MRKWEDLEPDCLVNIFQRVGFGALIHFIPLVCKPWYKASLDPLCWKSIDFPSSVPSKVIKHVVDRSCGTAVRVGIPGCCYIEDFTYISQRCPLLQMVFLMGEIVFPHSSGCCNDSFPLGRLSRVCQEKCEDTIAKLICNLKDLQILCLKPTFHFEKIITEIAIHCKNFQELFIQGDIGAKEASAIVVSLPNIKGLSFKKYSTIPKEHLMLLLSGCKELEYLKISNCFGFDADDEEILKMASSIKVFKAEGSKLYDELFDFFDDASLYEYIDSGLDQISSEEEEEDLNADDKQSG